MTEERLYTIPEAAALLRVSVATIRRMIARGELDAVRVGGQLRIKAASVKQYL